MGSGVGAFGGFRAWSILFISDSMDFRSETTSCLAAPEDSSFPFLEEGASVSMFLVVAFDSGGGFISPRGGGTNCSFRGAGGSAGATGISGFGWPWKNDVTLTTIAVIK